MKCPNCQGTGFLWSTAEWPKQVNCRRCKGTGKIKGKKPFSEEITIGPAKEDDDSMPKLTIGLEIGESALIILAGAIADERDKMLSENLEFIGNRKLYLELGTLWTEVVALHGRISIMKNKLEMER